MAYIPQAVPSDPTALPDFLRAEFQRLFQALNSQAELLRLATTYGTPDKPRTGDVRIADGSTWAPVVGNVPVWFDGTDWVPFGQSHPVGCYISGLPTASEVVLSYVATDPFTLPASLTNSQGASSVAATAQTDFDVKKNSTSIGTVRFAASGTTATFIAASATQFSAGDVLSIVAPGTPDATLAGIKITLRGSRN